MTEVEFHTGVGDSVGFACRLLRKAYRKGVRVLVTAPAPTLAALDRALWTFDERDFVPHLRLSAGCAETLLQRTPIWLAESAQARAPAPDPVLVNLGADAPENLAPYTRLIEIVSDDPDEQAAGRARWRAYRARGLDVTHHANAGA